MTEGEPGHGDPGDGSPRRRRWLRGWRALVAGISLLAAIVGLIAGILALLPDPDPPDPEATGSFEEDATVGPSSLGDYLADRRLDPSAYSVDELATAGLRFQLPVVLEGLDGSRVAVLWGLYDRLCSANLQPREEIDGAAFVPDSQAFGIVADVWLESGWAPPDDYCYKISLSRSGHEVLLDFFDHVFQSETALPVTPRPVLVNRVEGSPQPQLVARAIDGPGTTPGTGTAPPRDVLIPVLPVAPEDVPDALRAGEFPPDATVADDDPVTATTTTPPTGPTTTTPPTDGGTQTAPVTTSGG